MAFRCISFVKKINYNGITILRKHLISTVTPQKQIKQFKTENITHTHLNDPDTFGSLVGQKVIKESIEDEGDLREEKYLQEVPLQSQKLTIKQYADIIKQLVEHKRINEAIDVLETRMLKTDRVKPENYIYNILIGACADVGYTKKAFQLFNDMKRRALPPTGDTYTCLFEACMNSPWPAYGLKQATHLRNLMIEKNIEPNLTNFNVMIKTFGRCSDLPTAFKIVDEMISKNIKIRSHTFNHLLQACITDKESGLKYGLTVWRKMLKMKEKPNLHSFNLMLKCVKDCNLGTKDDLLALIEVIEESLPLISKEKLKQIEGHQNHSPFMNNDIKLIEEQLSNNSLDGRCKLNTNLNIQKEHLKEKKVKKDFLETNNSLLIIKNKDIVLVDQEHSDLEILQNYKKPAPLVPQRTVPNLLSKVVHTAQVLAFQDVNKPKDKFAIIGGQDDFLKEMEVYSVKPDIKTFTQMLDLIEDSTEAEKKLIETMQSLKIKTDIDFYNMLIKKRCLRMDYDNAFQVRDLIEEESRSRKKHPFNKKHKLHMNIMTYGTLALACSTKEKAEKLLNEMKEKQLKVNIQILGALLRNASINLQFPYVLYIMDTVKQENLKINYIFLKHLETFNERCVNIIKKNKEVNKDSSIFEAAYNRFSKIYKKWLIDVKVEEAFKPEHPWKQFMEPHPIPVQREKFQVVEPKMFYKRKRYFIPYTPRIK